MNKRSKLAALLGAGLLTFGVAGLVLASTPASDPGGVVPTFHDGNISEEGHGHTDGADCAGADAVGSNTADVLTTANGVEVTVTYDSDTKAVTFSADGGLVTIFYVKGGSGYNEYDYGAGIAADGNLFAPDTNGDGKPQGLSHWVACTGSAAATPTPTPTLPGGGGAGDTDQPPTDALAGQSGSSGPSDTAWLLVVGLGVLLASIVVLTPARAKSRR
jgi:hypothetical protein